MSVRIPLPTTSRTAGAKAHPYPFQIALQTLEFLQAALLYASFVDIAAGEFVRLPGGREKVEGLFTQKLGSKKTYDEAWGYLAKYQMVFERAPYQSVLIALNSHWDWYLRKLIEFVLVARAKIGAAALSTGDARRLKRSGSLPLIEQIEVVELSAGVRVTLTDEQRAELKEMALVRNLGLHNRWETDALYLTHTPRQGLQLGDLRSIGLDELLSWHRLLITLVNESSSKVAVAFVAAPDYP